MFAPVRIAIRKPSGMGETLYLILGRHGAEPLPERKPSRLKVRAPGVACSRAAASGSTS
jgi:hypothetical protein